MPGSFFGWNLSLLFWFWMDFFLVFFFFFSFSRLFFGSLMCFHLRSVYGEMDLL